MPFASDSLSALISLCIPIVALCIPIVAIVSFNWRKAKVAEYRAVVVQNMLDKGFSPDDVEKVLRANDTVNRDSCHKRRRRHSEYAR